MSPHLRIDGGGHRNTAPHVTCPNCDHEFEARYAHHLGIGSAIHCPACRVALECAQLVTIVEWRWIPKLGAGPIDRPCLQPNQGT
jgi:hypothetical protein